MPPSNGFLNNSQEKVYERIFTESSSTKNLLNVVRALTQKLGVFPIESTTVSNNNVTNENSVTEGTQTVPSDLSMDHVRREAEFMALFVVNSFGEENARKPPNKYCKTIRRTVNEISAKHDIVFKGIFNKLNPDDDNSLQTFLIVADELFDEGQVNWGRIVSVYAFAAHLAKYVGSKIDNDPNNQEDAPGLKKSVSVKEKIGDFVGKYVASKLGQWIVDHGGWDAFVEYFPDPEEFEAKVWKIGVLAALGLGAAATVIGTR